MRITLVQSEIETAIKQYVASQGINMAGKDLSIGFTAGRKETGIIADVVIEDSFSHNVSDPADDVGAAKPALVLAVSNTGTTADTATPVDQPAVVVDTAVEAAEVPAKTTSTSLFG